jgi:dihydrolipoamide dehydrogenase
MPEIIDSDLVIIGAGPGGYAAAFHAADKGMKVTLLDARERPGGTCLHVGCIPSKALLHVAKLITDVRDAKEQGLDFGTPKLDVAAVRNYWTKVVESLAKNLAGMCKQRKVELVNSKAVFEDSRTLKLADGSLRRFQHCIIATGSVPTTIPAFDIGSPRVMDSTAALRLEELPGKLLIVGGGYIGLELGYVYAALGSKVTVVELTGSLLPGVDADLVRPLAHRLKGQFEKIYLNTKVVKIADTGNGVRATLEGEKVTDAEPVFDRVLVAVGRKPNTRELGLDKTKVQVDPKGFIQTDNQRRTADERIFAIGDAAGEPMLAHKATYEGKLAVEVIAGEPTQFDARAIPAVVFTDPEIAWAGLTETDAEKQKKEVKITVFPWGASGRAATLGRMEGRTKIVFEPETERVLGVGIVGAGAGEMIAEGVLAVEMAATARDLALSIHPHPTLSETVMEAAEALHGNTTHMYKPKPAK